MRTSHGKLRFKIEPEGLPQATSGRVAWMLMRLLEAGPKGVSFADSPAPRLSWYVAALRKRGVVITMRMESHDGDFPGQRGRYRLGSKITVIEIDERRAA